MTEKHLTESGWKTYAKGRGYKDAALLKALADWGRAEREGTDAQVKSLDVLEKQADALLKECKGDKDLVSYLGELAKAVGRARKSAEQAAKQAAAQATQPEDEEDESAALLTTKLVPLLRQVAKGDTMHTMLASAGKQLVVMLSRKPITPARRKLLAEELGASGAIKYFVGTCQLEQNATTFVLSTPVAGMAKRIKAALLQQTGLRVKVRCRGEDGQTDDDGETEDGAPQAQVAQADATSAASAAFKARLTALLPRIKDAAGAGAGSDAAQQAKLKAAEAGALASKSDFAAANSALNQLEALLNDAGAAANGGPSLVQLGKARIEWGHTRAHAVAELTRLKSILQHEYHDAADEQPALAKALQRVDDTIAAMDEELSERLDQLLNAAPAQRSSLTVATKATLQRLVQRLGSDEVLLAIDGNELAPEMKIAEPLRAKLNQIVTSLA